MFFIMWEEKKCNKTVSENLSQLSHFPTRKGVMEEALFIADNGFELYIEEAYNCDVIRAKK